MAHEYGRWRPDEVNEDLIHSFVHERKAEDVDLEFKSGDAIDPDGTANRNQRRENLRDILARYACAFANAQGGLLVVGVETGRDRKRGRDVAVGWAGTEEHLGRDRILDLLREVADPRFTTGFLGGLRSEVFDDPSDQRRHGCWVLVPRSDDATHQIVGGKHDGIYVAATQEGVRLIRHDDLVRRLCGRGTALTIVRASVRKGSYSQRGGRSGDYAEFTVTMAVRNAGPGSATDLVVEACVPSARVAPGAQASFAHFHGPADWQLASDEGPYAVWRVSQGESLHEGSETAVEHPFLVESGRNSPLHLQYLAAYRAKAQQGSSPVVLFGFETMRVDGGGGPGWGEPNVKQSPVAVAEEEIEARVRLALWLPGQYPYPGEPWSNNA